MMKPAKRLYEFGPYRVDAADRLLLKEGKVVPLPPKVFDILLTFVERSGRVLDKDELMQEVWPDTFVEEGNLARNVSTLRRALGESEDGRQYIETIPRRGYRFVAKVKGLSDGTLIVHERSSLTIEQEEESDATGFVDVAGDAEPATVAIGDSASASPARLPDQMAMPLAGALPQSLMPATQPAAASASRTKRRLFIGIAVMLIAAAIAGSFFAGKR
ncbi:MAG TPA: transcriptional regulator, partial [Blastocatellia bacterium]|nr:transcriptional regulator [Blastocatellia bacterium]